MLLTPSTFSLFRDIASNIHVTDAKMILSTKAVGTETYRVGDGNGISAVKNVTYDTMRAQNPEYAIHTQSRYDED
ncbi:hypothetical protein KCU89_g5949, partial [Aureobasidium melanogenum]